MSIELGSWWRVRGITSPMSYRIYGPPQVGFTGPTGTSVMSAHTIYCVPFLSGQGGQVETMHSRVSVPDANVTAHWGIYAATHTRFSVPNGLVLGNSFNMGSAVQSVAMVHSMRPNSLYYLAWACGTHQTMNRFQFTTAYAMLGCDSSGQFSHFGVMASYDVTNGLPAQFPQSGYQFCGQDVGGAPPWLGLHYT